MLARHVLIVCIAAFLSVSARHAPAQFGFSGGQGISAAAREDIAVEPQKLRLTFWATAQGLDAKSAIKTLADHKARVKEELVAMKADEKSIQFSGARIQSGSGQDGQQMQVVRMMRNMGRGGRSVNADALPKLVTAVCAVRVEWALPTKDADALALLPSSLTAQIEQRDLEGKKNVPELSPKQQEQMDEMKAMMEEQGAYYDSSNDQNAVAIEFIGTVSEQDAAEASKRAYQAAVAKAEQIAAAAGIKLGKLSAMHADTNTDTTGRDPYDFAMRVGAYGSNPRALPSAFAKQAANEVLATNADELKYTTGVTVTFEIP